MPRLHEDRERHTLVDHRSGGSPVVFPKNCWVVVGLARVKADRNDACVSAYETLIERAQTSNVHAAPAVVFASENGRRVLVLVGVPGHEGFRHLTAAWDDHHRSAEHRVIAESVSFNLFSVATAIDAADIDPDSHDAYVYERVARPVAQTSKTFAALHDSDDFRGATLLGSDAAGQSTSVILSRFVTVAAYDAFRGTSAATAGLGLVGARDESSFGVRVRKTFTV